MMHVFHFRHTLVIFVENDNSSTPLGTFVQEDRHTATYVHDIHYKYSVKYSYFMPIILSYLNDSFIIDPVIV